MSPVPSPAAFPAGVGKELEECRILVVTHGADHSRVALLLLWWLRWVVAHTSLRIEVLILGPGPLVPAFRTLATTHVIDITTEPIWPEVEVARVLDRLDPVRRRRHDAAARIAGLGPFDLAVFTSGLSAVGLDLLAERPPVVISWLHLMGTSLEHLISPAARNAMLTSDWFIACADAVSQTLVGACRVDRTRVVRHHGFIEPFETDPAGSARLREQLGIPSDALVLGGVGVPQWRKGADLYLQILAQVRRLRPDLDVHGIWAGASGPGGVDAPMQADLAALGLTDQVHLLAGYDEPAAVLGAFDVFCLTSREDPFPLTLLEAGWLGLPVVSFANGGVRELGVGVGHDHLVNVVDCLDVERFSAEVVALLDDTDRRIMEGKRLHEWVGQRHLTDYSAPLLLADIRTMVRTTTSGATEPDRAWEGTTL